MGKLILLRHGESTKAEKGTIHHHQDDAPLSDKGRRSLLATIPVLKGSFVSMIYTSPEKRAEQSARLISRELKTAYLVVKELEERNWGIYEGRLWSEVETILKNFSLEERYTYVPPRGESWQAMAERAGKFLKGKILEDLGRTILAVTHVGVIRALIPFLTKSSLSESFKYNPEHGSLISFDFDGTNFKLL